MIPFPTPFDTEGEVDVRAVGANIERWNETGISGYVALGSTGERVHLDERERVLVVEAARARVPDERAFIVGVGEQSARATIKDARRFAAAGADALLVITPHFYRAAMTADALVRYYTEVADAAPVGIILYNIPQNTGVHITPEAVARLSEHSNILGIKDSSGEMVSLMEMLRLASQDFALLTGHAGVLQPSLSAGADGGILAAACVAPALCVQIYEAHAAGEAARARRLQRRLAPVARAVTTRYGIGGLKAALDLLGYRGGAVRAPLRSPDEDARRELARLIEEELAPEAPVDELERAAARES